MVPVRETELASSSLGTIGPEPRSRRREGSGVKYTLTIPTTPPNISIYAGTISSPVAEIKPSAINGVVPPKTATETLNAIAVAPQRTVVGNRVGRVDGSVLL